MLNSRPHNYTFHNTNVREQRQNFRVGVQHNTKKIIHINTGIEYPSITDASIKLGIHKSYISSICRERIEHWKGNKFKFV